jgi:glycosyltransferase involved in cell wall biosynthesis
VVSRIPELEGFMRRNNSSGALRGVMSHSHHFIAVSQAVRENLVRHHAVDPARISVVYGACDSAADYPKSAGLRQERGFGSADFLVCGCGTMDWRKGFDLFVQTAFRVCCIEGRKDVRFLWIGSPISKETGIEYAYEVEMLGLNSSLILMGAHENPSEVFAQCDLFFLSSREDPFPLVMLEAARQGLPIICFESSGGATEFVQPAFGSIVPLLDVVAASRDVIRRADDRVGAASTGQHARRRAMEFTVERMGAGVAAVLGMLISRADLRPDTTQL